MNVVTRKPIARSLPFDSPRVRRTTEEIITAYRNTGSVWRAGQVLGVSGQSVWERLRAVGEPMQHREWETEELAELTRLAGECTVGEIASRLGRSYAGVACKISELGIGNRYGNKLTRKTPRGYSKKRVRRLIDELDADEMSIRAFCRQRGLDLELFIQRAQAVDRAWWDDYTRRRSDLTAKTCPYCQATFYPLTKKQQACTRKCASQSRRDRQYFGGNRRATIGLASGVCQLCMREKAVLSSHHVIGKQNDPNNEYLIALCSGCHQVVGSLAGRTFVDEEQGWENLVSLVLMRRLADRNRAGQTAFVGVHAAVDVEWLSREDAEILGVLDEQEA